MTVNPSKRQQPPPSDTEATSVQLIAQNNYGGEVCSRTRRYSVTCLFHVKQGARISVFDTISDVLLILIHVYQPAS